MVAVLVFVVAFAVAEAALVYWLVSRHPERFVAVTLAVSLPFYRNRRF